MSKQVLNFYVVRDEMRKHPNVEIKLPKRGSKNAMAYDFFAPEAVTVPPLSQVMIWTDVKAQMPDNLGLILNVRSSMGIAGISLANSQGWVDCDFANNPSNDGNIGFCLRNTSAHAYHIEAGDRIGQGMFVTYYTTDDEYTAELAERKGGFGSTGK